MRETNKYCPYCRNPLIVKFIENRNRSFCTVCQQPIYDNPVPATAAVVLDPQNRILLVKRKFEPKKGEWCLPGGYLEIDETPEQCCLRELEEETAGKGKIDRLIGVRVSRSLLYNSVLIIGYLIKDFSGRLRAGDDAIEVAFFPLSQRPTLAFISHEFMVSRVSDSVKGLGPELAKRNLNDLGVYVITSQNHVDIASKAVVADARIIQYRDKSSSRTKVLQNTIKIRSLTEKSGTIFILNDYIDIALIAGADGVHLGQEDVPIEQARKITPSGFLIGISTHSLSQALAAEKGGADYIGVGPVFATPTKEHYPAIGLETVKQVLNKITIPVVAIGGLDKTNIASLLKAGVKNFAMVRQLQSNTRKNIIALNRKIANRI